MFKLIIAGGREFNNYYLLWNKVSYLLKDKDGDDVEIVSGGAKGADSLGEKFARSKEMMIKIFPAKWTSQGKSAGPIRNKNMADYADALVAFWDGKSSGTGDMIDAAKEKNLPVRIVNY